MCVDQECRSRVSIKPLDSPPLRLSTWLEREREDRQESIQLIRLQTFLVIANRLIRCEITGDLHGEPNGEQQFASSLISSNCMRCCRTGNFIMQNALYKRLY